MGKKLTVLIAACLLAGMASAEFKAGAALRVVTPDPLLPVSGGVGEPTPVSEQRGDLFARAIVVENDGTRMALVSVDFLGWPSVLIERVLERSDSVPDDNVLIGATHTHSAPDPYAFPDMQGNHYADLDYLDRVCTLIAEAIDEAADNLQPATLRLAMGEVEGKIAYNYYAPQLWDPEAGVVQFVPAGGGTPIATLLNFAIHPEILGESVGILSPDLCGPLYERIEAETGGMAMFMNGALGGMITADNRTESGRSNRTWEECVRIGTALADETLRILEENAIEVADPALVVAAREVDFTVDSKMIQAIVANSPLGVELGEDNTYPIRLNLVNLGPAQLFTIPGEALPNIGFYLKRKMPTDYPFLLGCTNEAVGYLMVKEDWRSYARYDYISLTSLGEYAGETLIEAALEMIAEQPAPQPATGAEQAR